MVSNVLVGCPVYSEHSEHVKGFVDAYSDYDILLIDNTWHTDGYYHKLKEEYVDRDNVTVLRHGWNPRTRWYLYMLGDVWQKICDYAVENNYDYYFWSSLDIRLGEGCSIENLIAHEKDIIGYPTNMYALNGPASVYKSDWQIWDEESCKFRLDYYSWDEIKKLDGVHPVHGCIGATLVSTKVLGDEKVGFDCPSKSTDIYFGEDLLFLQSLARAGYTPYCDFSGRAINYTNLNKYVADLRKLYYLHNDIPKMQEYELSGDYGKG